MTLLGIKVAGVLAQQLYQPSVLFTMPLVYVHMCVVVVCLVAGMHVNWMEASLEQLSTPLPPWAIRAGARETIYHDPRNTTAAIVTCGGLCPGLNDVVAVSGADVWTRSAFPWGGLGGGVHQVICGLACRRF